eukprot:scaffold31262_cov128-Isochrysis_galbana.AAC.4
MVRSRCIDVAHILSGLSYLVFAVLAIVSIVISSTIFDDSCVESGNTIRCPILFCGFASLQATIQTALEGGNVACFDKQLIGMLVPVSAVLSIVAILTHVIFLWLARCRSGACGMSHAFTDGVVAGMSVTLVFLLFVTALVLLAVAMVARYFGDQYGAINELDGRVVSVELNGNTNVVIAAAAFCFMSCLLTVMENILLCRREMMAPSEPAEAVPAKEVKADEEVGVAEPAAPAAPSGSDNPFKDNAHLQNQ